MLSILSALLLGQCLPPMQADYGQQTYVGGHRLNGDSSAAVVFGNYVKRSVGAFGTNATQIEFRNGPDHADQVMVVDTAGNVVAWGAFVNGTGISGAITVDATPNNYLGVQGRIAEDRRGWYIPDAGMDKVYPPNGALHGELSISSSVHKEAGFFIQVKNGSKTDGGTDRNEWFYVDSRMGFGQRNGWPYSQFPGEDVLIVTSSGQHHYGALESTLYWATNRTGYGANHWHAKLPTGNADDGGYGQLAYSHETVTPQQLSDSEQMLMGIIAAMEARLQDAGL